MLYNVIYHIQIICIYLPFAFMFYACIYLRSGYRKELYVPEGTITVRDNDLYLYDPNGVVIMIQTGSMSFDTNGASISINCMLQQLYPYRHAYLSNYLVISRQFVSFISFTIYIPYPRITIVIRKSYAIFSYHLCMQLYSCII